MNKRQRNKPRPSYIGRRTGVDVVQGKKIRKLVDGTDNFDDYFSDSDSGNSTQTNNSTLFQNESKKILENVAVRHRDSESCKKPSRFLKKTLNQRSEDYEDHNDYCSPGHVNRSEVTRMKTVRDIGRRTGIPVLNGKKIRTLADGTDQFTDYLTDSDFSNRASLSMHSSLKTRNERSLENMPNFDMNPVSSMKTPRSSIRKSVKERSGSYESVDGYPSPDESKRSEVFRKKSYLAEDLENSAIARSKLTQTSYFDETETMPSKNSMHMHEKSCKNNRAVLFDNEISVRMSFDSSHAPNRREVLPSSTAARVSLSSELKSGKKAKDKRNSMPKASCVQNIEKEENERDSTSDVEYYQNDNDQEEDSEKSSTEKSPRATERGTVQTPDLLESRQVSNTADSHMKIASPAHLVKRKIVFETSPNKGPRKSSRYKTKHLASWQNDKISENVSILTGHSESFKSPSSCEESEDHNDHHSPEHVKRSEVTRFKPVEDIVDRTGIHVLQGGEIRTQTDGSKIYNDSLTDPDLVDSNRASRKMHSSVKTKNEQVLKNLSNFEMNSVSSKKNLSSSMRKRSEENDDCYSCPDESKISRKKSYFSVDKESSATARTKHKKSSHLFVETESIPSKNSMPKSLRVQNREKEENERDSASDVEYYQNDNDQEEDSEKSSTEKSPRATESGTVQTPDLLESRQVSNSADSFMKIVSPAHLVKRKIVFETSPNKGPRKSSWYKTKHLASWQNDKISENVSILTGHAESFKSPSSCEESEDHNDHHSPEHVKRSEVTRIKSVEDIVDRTGIHVLQGGEIRTQTDGSKIYNDSLTDPDLVDSNRASRKMHSSAKTKNEQVLKNLSNFEMNSVSSKKNLSSSMRKRSGENDDCYSCPDESKRSELSRKKSYFSVDKESSATARTKHKKSSHLFVETESIPSKNSMPKSLRVQNREKKGNERNSTSDVEYCQNDNDQEKYSEKSSTEKSLRATESGTVQIPDLLESRQVSNTADSHMKTVSPVHSAKRKIVISETSSKKDPRRSSRYKTKPLASLRNERLKFVKSDADREKEENERNSTSDIEYCQNDNDQEEESEKSSTEKSPIATESGTVQTPESRQVSNTADSHMKTVSPVHSAKCKNVFSETSPNKGPRRSSRYKTKPLASWRNERLKFVKSGTEFKCVGIDKGTAEDDFALRALKKKLGAKVKKRKIVSSSKKQGNNRFLKKTPIVVPGTGEIVELHLHRPFNTCEWILPPHVPNPGFMVTKTFLCKHISFGFLDMAGHSMKEKQLSPSDNVHFVVIKGVVEVEINETYFTFQKGDSFIVPQTAGYSISNNTSSNAMLAFSSFRIPFFKYQEEE